MLELFLPVALGMLGGGIGLALAGRMRQNRKAALEEADALQARGELRAAAVCLERALRSAADSEIDIANRHRPVVPGTEQPAAQELGLRPGIKDCHPGGIKTSGHSDRAIAFGFQL